MPVVPAIQEAEVREWQFGGQQKRLSVAQVLEQLFSKCKALNSISSIEKNFT
jgi:hypothetical protein